MLPPAAILYAILGIAMLSAMDAAVKAVALAETVVAATWLRYVFGALILLPAMMLLRQRIPDRRGLRAHALRGLLLTFTSLTFFYGITILPLAEAITLAFIAPLMVPPLGALLIGEKMRGRALLAAIAGFAGVLVTVQGAEPAAADGDRTLAILAILVSALLYALQSLILRQRAQQDDPVSVAALAMVVPLAILTPLSLAFAPLPQAGSLGMALLSGVFGAAGVLGLTRAYALAEAQLLIVFEYTGLFWAALLGWFLFAEVPRVEIFIGATIIAGACLYIAWGERRGRKMRQHQPGVPPADELPAPPAQKQSGF